MSIAARLKIGVDAREMLDNAIVARIAQAPFDALRALSALRLIDPDLSWSPFVDAAVNRLKNGAPSHGLEPQPSATESGILLQILRLAPDGSLLERAKLVDDGVALEYLWIANQEGSSDTQGDWLYEEFRKYQPGFAGQPESPRV